MCGHLGAHVPERGNGLCKGPEAGACLVYWKSIQINVAKTKQSRDMGVEVEKAKLGRIMEDP